MFEANKREKKRHYNDRIIRIEGGSFTPLVFTTNGGTGREAQIFIRSLAALMAEKRGELFSLTLNYLRTKISFALIRSTVLCIRGSRIPRKAAININDIGITEAAGYV